MTKQQIRSGVSGIAKTIGENLFDTVYQSMFVEPIPEPKEQKDETMLNPEVVLEAINKSRDKIETLEKEMKKLDDIHAWLKEWKRNSN